VVWGAAIGHTARPMLTLPLGVRARLRADDEPRLEILESACKV
jgi:muramoyltetrapeptide carboxypeptidase LdcA involved in peptidoglycan recycling